MTGLEKYTATFNNLIYFMQGMSNEVKMFSYLRKMLCVLSVISLFTAKYEKKNLSKHPLSVLIPGVILYLLFFFFCLFPIKILYIQSMLFTLFLLFNQTSKIDIHSFHTLSF